MNPALCAGAVMGWAAYSRLGFNRRRGLMISIAIGMAGGLAGGAWVTPLLGALPVNAGDFNPVSLVTALACALGCLTVADMIHERFGV